MVGWGGGAKAEGCQDSSHFQYFLYSLFPIVGWTHAYHVAGCTQKNLRMGTPQPFAIIPSVEEDIGWVSTPHLTLCLWTPNTDLAPTGFGQVESLPWGMNIKTLGWLLPAIIRLKVLPYRDVPGLQQQKAAGEEDSFLHRLGTRGSLWRPGSPARCRRARVLCWLLSQSLH